MILQETWFSRRSLAFHISITPLLQAASWFSHTTHVLIKKVSFFCFSNGSVKVKFRVVVKVEKVEKKEPLVIAKKVGKTLRVSVEDGRIGSLKVKKTVELRGLFTDYSFLTFFYSLTLIPSSTWFFFSSFLSIFLSSFHSSIHPSIRPSV